jgi:Glycosyltransferase family 87
LALVDQGDMPRSLVSWFALTLAAGLVCAWTGFLPWKRVLLGQNDFLAFYGGAKLAFTSQLYSADAMQVMQDELAHIWVPAVLYLRPPFYAVLLKPFTLLPYHAAFGVFEALNIAAMCLFLRIFARRDVWLWLIGGFSVPVVTALANGQDVMLILGVFAATILLARRGWDFAAGLVLALCAIKFHLFVFVPLVLVLQKRWRMVGGACCGIGALYLLSAIAQGWWWPPAYAQFLQTPQLHPGPYAMPNLHGLLTAIGAASLPLEILLAAMVAVAVIYVSLKPGKFEPALAIAIAAGLLASHHAYLQDCCLLMPLAALGGSRVRVASLAVLAPPMYFVALAESWLGATLALAIVALTAFAAIENGRSGSETAAEAVLDAA